MKRLIPLLAAASLSSGCYKIDYVNASSMGVPSHTEWHHIGILALVEFSAPVSLQTICPSGFTKVHHEVSLPNSAVTFLLSFVGLNWAYTPSTIEVYCKSGTAYNVELDRDGMALSAERVQ